MPTEALLFQTGYLTIVRSEPRGGEMFYRLGYPNLEVRQSLNRSLLNHMTGDPSRRSSHSARLYDLLLANDFEGLRTLFRSFYASIPHQWYTNNDIASYEGYYASVFYSYFAGLGLDITVEDSTSHGRLDMAVRFNGNVYLLESQIRCGACAAGAVPVRPGARHAAIRTPPTGWEPLQRLHPRSTRLYLDSDNRLHRMLAERRIDRAGRAGEGSGAIGTTTDLRSQP